ncbi:hypothetical protein [Mucilaginibacter terrae]|uniref:Auto-transporter adhesin head GIN domain-containing protein n=1 Tax=Mucilaginibacter terrae TaxID=1955052 RepID=A0ABU3H1L7_9SPHI|nr:hypothetical protein [Mucilaginibacter terrae]MDT3404810.1 hypothetical protein [Mucilaginibacter terrae]
MKHRIGIILLLLVSCAVYGQSSSSKVLIPEADSMVVEMDKLFINPKNVKEVFVLKDPSSELSRSHRGANLIMTFKKKPKFVALNNLKVDSIEKKSSRISYIIDGGFISDTTGVKIDILNIKKLDALFTGDMPGLYVNQTGTVYLITTKSKGKKLQQPK